MRQQRVGTEEDAPPEESRAPAAVHADVVEVRRGDVSSPLVITGTILPAQESNVGAKIAGRIERILVEEGMPVRQGAIIAPRNVSY